MADAWEGLNPPYATIVVDPPWPDPHKLTGVTRVGRVKKDRSIDAQYSTMPLAEISALPVGDLAAHDAHCYLWTTNLHLPQAFGILDSWGFGYRTMLTWVKLGHLGMGAYFRTQTEHVLFAVRGSLPTLARDQRTSFEARKRGHSGSHFVCDDV